MKKVIPLLIAVPVMLLNNLAYADEPAIDEITIDLAEQSEFKAQARGERQAGKEPGRNTIVDYMLANGDITQEEVDERNAQRDETRKELLALKESGDTEQLKARIDELRQERDARREEMRAYVDSHDELKVALQEQKQQMQELRKERKEELKAKREERKEEMKERRDERKEELKERRNERKEEQKERGNKGRNG